MLAVDPGYQGAGIGTALVQRAVAEVEAEGIGLAVVATGGDPDHAPARALYEKLSFNPVPRPGTTGSHKPPGDALVGLFIHP